MKEKVVISSIKKNNSKTLYVTTKSEENYKISSDIVSSKSLKTGLYISKASLEKYDFETNSKEALNDSLKILSRSMKTEHQLKEYLVNKGYTCKIILNTIKKLEEYKYIDDKKYCNAYVNYKISSKGPSLILMELIRKGVARETANEAIKNIKNEDDSILALAEKYMKNKDYNYDNKIKLYNYLYRKGFNPNKVMNILENNFDL